MKKTILTAVSLAGGLFAGANMERCGCIKIYIRPNSAFVEGHYGARY